MLRSSSELLGSELQALLSPYKSAACWRESPLLRSFEVKNSELWLQMGPASAVCGELGLPSLERDWALLFVPVRMYPCHLTSGLDCFCHDSKSKRKAGHVSAAEACSISMLDSPETRRCNFSVHSHVTGTIRRFSLHHCSACRTIVVLASAPLET